MCVIVSKSIRFFSSAMSFYRWTFSYKNYIHDFARYMLIATQTVDFVCGGGEIEWIRLDWQRCASYRVYQNHIQAMNVLNRCVFFHHFQHDYPLTWSNDRHEFLPWAHFNVTFFHTHAHTHKKDNYYYGEHIQKNNYSKSTISKSQRVFFVPHGKRIKLHQYGNEVEISENAWKCEKVIYVTGFQDLM